MLPLNESYKNIKASLTIHWKYKYLDSTVQRAEDRRQKFYFCRLPFAVNVKLSLSISRNNAGIRDTVIKPVPNVATPCLERRKIMAANESRK